eukprot:scaffold521_cov167-Amphora_coffeaeformis.AAC.39
MWARARKNGRWPRVSKQTMWTGTKTPVDSMESYNSMYVDTQDELQLSPICCSFLRRCRRLRALSAKPWDHLTAIELKGNQHVVSIDGTGRTAVWSPA